MSYIITWLPYSTTLKWVLKYWNSKIWQRDQKNNANYKPTDKPASTVVCTWIKKIISLQISNNIFWKPLVLNDICFITRPDTQIPHLHAGGQGQYSMSGQYLGRSSEGRNLINAKKSMCDGQTVQKTDRRTDGWTDKVGCRVACMHLKKVIKNEKVQ